jgi:hypothetical protein
MLHLIGDAHLPIFDGALQILRMKLVQTLVDNNKKVFK